MTVRLIQGRDRVRHPVVIDAMFRGRAEMFAARLKWDVVVKDGWEIDVYDDLDPLDLVSLSERGQVRGSLRLMPTTGRTLMTEVFARSFEEPVDVRSATVWEGTRFCVHPDAHPLLTRTGLSHATSELFIAMCEVALTAGLTHILAIYDRTLPRIYRRIGWMPETIGASDAYPHGRIFAGLFEVSEAALAAMRALSGIECSVLADGVSAQRLSQVS